MIDVHGDRSLRFTPEEQAYLARAERQAQRHNNARPVPALPAGSPISMWIIGVLVLSLLGIFYHSVQHGDARQGQHPATAEPLLSSEPPVDITGIVRPLSLDDIRSIQMPILYLLPPAPPPETPVLLVQTSVSSEPTLYYNAQQFAGRPEGIGGRYSDAGGDSVERPVYVVIVVADANYSDVDPQPKKRRSFISKPFRFVGRAVRKVLIDPFRGRKNDEQHLRELLDNQQETRR